jgi:hypothetical protein
MDAGGNGGAGEASSSMTTEDAQMLIKQLDRMIEQEPHDTITPTTTTTTIPGTNAVPPTLFPYLQPVQPLPHTNGQCSPVFIIIMPLSTVYTPFKGRGYPVLTWGSLPPVPP